MPTLSTYGNVRYRDPETDKRLGFLTNDFSLPVLTVVGLYRFRSLLAQRPHQVGYLRRASS